MYPVRPVLTYIPDGVSPPYSATYAEKQPDYNPLPVVVHENAVTSRWKLTFLERLHMLVFGYFFITQKNFGDKLQPILPSTMQPKPWR